MTLPSSTAASSTPAPVYSLFWPVLILILGLAASYSYQVSNLMSQREALVQANEQMLPKVSLTEHNYNKLQALGKAVLSLSNTDTNAARLVSEFKIQEIPPAPPPDDTK